jgi:acetyltransferase-like isoleucine patch superfamily enzyme
MGKAIHKLTRAIAHVTGWREFRQRMRYRGLAIGRRAELEVAGELRYGEHSVIGEGSHVLVPAGATLELGAQTFVGRHVELGPSGRIALGDDTSVQDRCVLLGDITVGRHCLFAPNVFASSGRHYFDLHPGWLIRDQDRLAARDPALAAAHSKPIRIDDDCWLGVNSVIMPGVIIGRGAVVGAGSVITADVPPYAVVVGSPARVVRQRLEFKPPRRIASANLGDAPYFYAGFDLTQAAAPQATQRGHLATGSFELRMDTTGARALRLTASTESGACELVFGTQRRALGGTAVSVEFELDNAPAELSVRVIPGTASVRIAEAVAV